MGSSDHTDTESSSSSSFTLESVFGVRGSVRLVPQGASQKPHIVLKRECSVGDGAESNSLSGKARFSLIANKRFTISKGHTLLFGIVDPRGDDDVKPFNGESTFAFEFDYNDQVHSRRDCESLPAKMRKSLTGTKTFDMFAERQTQNSLGFPGYPLSIPDTRVFASSSVQTDPTEHRDTSAPLTRTPSPMSLTGGDLTRVYPSPISTVNHPSEGSLLLVEVQEDESDNNVPSNRSISSMALSSPMLGNDSSSILSSPPHGRSSVATEPLDDGDTAMLPITAEVAHIGSSVRGPCDVEGSEQVSSAEKQASQVTDENVEKEVTVAPTHLPTQRVQDSLSQEKTSSESQRAPARPNLPNPLSEKLPSTSTPTPTPTPTPDLPKTATREIPPNMPRAMSRRVVNGLRNGYLPDKPHVPSIPTPRPTISNPLGIRPSASALPKPPPKGPKSLLGKAITAATSTGVATARALEILPRKPVVVSTNWSAMRGFATLGNANTTSAPSRLTGSKPFATVTKTEDNSSANLSVLLRYSVSPPTGVPSNSLASDLTTSGTLHGVVRATDSANVSVSTENSGAKQKWKRIEGCSPSLKRPRNEPSQGEDLANVTKEDSQQPRKKVKTEESELQGEFNLLHSLLMETNSQSPFIDETSGGCKVGDKVKSLKSARKRSRKKKKKLLNNVSLWGDPETVENESGREAEASQIESWLAEGNAMKRPAKPNESESPTSLTSNTLAQKQTQLPRLTHPLPPKPQILAMASSYRPSIKRERDRSRDLDFRRSRSRSRDRSRTSRSRSRSRERGKDRTRERERTRSRSRGRDPSITDRRNKVSEPLGAQEHDSLTQTVKSALSREPITVGNTTCPTTMPTLVHQIQGAKPIAVWQILFASDGKKVGIVCSDKTIRVWETNPQIVEVAKLLHSAPIVTMCWMEQDKGVLTLCEDGSVITWILQGKEWQHTRLFQVQTPMRPVAMAYRKDRLAVSTPSSVKVWLCKGSWQWQPQREIKRSGVTALSFHLDGGLFGGCQDGTIWYCEVPNGTLRAYLLITKQATITSIENHPNGLHLLASQNGISYLMTHDPSTVKAKLDKFYAVSGTDFATYPSIFATGGQAVISGSIKGCALVWDRKKGNVVYGLRHLQDDSVQTIACFDGQPGVEGMMVSGTKNGRIFWWPTPQAAPTGGSKHPQ